MDEVTFSRLFDNREGPYHLYDSHDRPLIRAETGKRVLAALLDSQSQLVFLDDPGCLEGSVLKKTFWAREWLSNPVEPKPCSCGDGRCKGCLVITLHDAYVGPNWKLTFRGSGMWSTLGFPAPCRLRVGVPAGQALEYRRSRMPSRAGGDSGGRSLFFTHRRSLEPQSGSANKSPKALAAYLIRSASRSGTARARVLTAEEPHECARQAAEARWTRRKPR
jgi:hypothetical protein